MVKKNVITGGLMKIKGVTLIEVLVASTIGAIGIGITLMCIVQYNRIAVNSAAYAEAVNIAKYQMESLNRAAPSVLTTLAGAFPLGSTTKYDKIYSNAVGSKEKIYRITYKAEYVPLNDVKPGAIDLVVQVNWDDVSGKDNNIKLQTRHWQTAF